MNSQSLMSRAWMPLAGFGLILLAFGLAGFLPYQREAARLNRSLAECRAQIALRAAEAAQLKDLMKQRQLVNLQVRDYDRLVPASQDLGTFWEALSAELETAGLRDTTRRALAPNKLGKCQQLPIEIRGTGTFAQFRQFLERLEALPRKSSISKLQIEGEAAMTGRVAAELTLSIYSTKP